MSKLNPLPAPAVSKGKPTKEHPVAPKPGGIQTPQSSVAPSGNAIVEIDGRGNTVRVVQAAGPRAADPRVEARPRPYDEHRPDLGGLDFPIGPREAASVLHCASGLVGWLDAYGIDRRRFFSRQVMASEILATGDAYGYGVVRAELDRILAAKGNPDG